LLTAACQMKAIISPLYKGTASHATSVPESKAVIIATIVVFK
jgi:hypothetical protein